jgi:hypothetical protein
VYMHLFLSVMNVHACVFANACKSMWKVGQAACNYPNQTHRRTSIVTITPKDTCSANAVVVVVSVIMVVWSTACAASPARSSLHVYVNRGGVRALKCA